MGSITRTKPKNGSGVYYVTDESISYTNQHTIMEKHTMKTHKKTFATKAHMLQFWRDFKDELIGCHEVGQVGEYVLKFSTK